MLHEQVGICNWQPGRVWLEGFELALLRVMSDARLGGGNSNIFWNFHPENLGNDPLTSIFFKWVETTN